MIGSPRFSPRYSFLHSMEGEGGGEMFLQMLLELGVAMLAIYGLSCAARVLTEWIFPQKRLVMAVELCTEEDARDLDLLLSMARTSVMRRGRGRICVLISTELMQGQMGQDLTLYEEYEALLEQYGAECYLIEVEEGR